ARRGLPRRARTHVSRRCGLARVRLGRDAAGAMRLPELRTPPAILLAVPLLALARLAPETGAGLWLRLAAATLVVLLPGRLLARALGRRNGSATFAWTLAALAAALAVTFAVHGSLA